ncbi:MAG: hypothetical protein JNK48_34730, partial [Bryobacterales bacterium]|nr:hypothetical protein [Bryobacterales bacterium]
CSGAQFEALRGRGGVAPDNSLFVLPGSQRLITEESIHGDNNDVLPADRRTRGNSGWGGSNRGRGQWTVITRVVAELDVVILSDGRVLGPDSLGTVEGLERDGG